MNIPVAFTPNLSTLPIAPRALWPELATTPEAFTLYGGTALALRLGHRASVDFDFFSNGAFDPERLAESIPYPLITLKALSYFEDVPTLPGEVRARLARAVEAVDVTALPVLTPYAKRPGENGMTL
jgi:hypothetical protein